MKKERRFERTTAGGVWGKKENGKDMGSTKRKQANIRGEFI